MTLTENSLLCKRTSLTSIKPPVQAEIQHFFLARTQTKNTAQNAPKLAIWSKQFIFRRARPPLQTLPLVGRGAHPHTTPLPYLQAPSRLSDPHLRPQNSSQIYATGWLFSLRTFWIPVRHWWALVPPLLAPATLVAPSSEMKEHCGHFEQEAEWLAEKGLVLSSPVDHEYFDQLSPPLSEHISQGQFLSFFSR